MFTTLRVIARHVAVTPVIVQMGSTPEDFGQTYLKTRVPVLN
jgi:hypothetical protein